MQMMSINYQEANDTPLPVIYRQFGYQTIEQKIKNMKAKNAKS